MSILGRLAAVDFGQELDDHGEERLTWLLADFLACVEFGSGIDPVRGQTGAGVCERAGWLALQAGTTDLDDVDWRSLHHPGSVVWPAVIAAAGHVRCGGEAMRRAARCGYATAATMADLLGPRHRARWHVTATAGAIGAAAAASALMGLDPEGGQRAMSLAAANAGGLALAARQRRGAAAFNRSAAAVLGVSAAQGALAGAAAIEDPICAPGGLLEAMDGRADGCMDALEPTLRTGVGEACVRLYPVTGFLQSAVEAVASARRMNSGELDRLQLELAEGAVWLVSDEDHGPWWNARLALLRSWAHADPAKAGTPCLLDERHDLVSLAAGDLAPGQARVILQAGDGQAMDLFVPAPDQPTGELPALLERKWAGVLGLDPARPIARARELLEP